MNIDTVSSTSITQSEERMVRIMQLLGDPTRFKMLKVLTSQREMCVSEIAHELDVTVSAVSQHFRSFEFLGLVNKQRTGQKICYKLKNNDPFVETLIHLSNTSS